MPRLDGRRLTVFEVVTKLHYENSIDFSIEDYEISLKDAKETVNDVIVKVTDAYTVASMIRVDAPINRVPGVVTPLGRTNVEFNWIYKDALLKK